MIGVLVLRKASNASGTSSGGSTELTEGSDLKMFVRRERDAIATGEVIGVVTCGETGGATGGVTTGGASGGASGGATDGATGGATGVVSGGATGGERGGATAGATGGATGGASGGATGGATGGVTGGATGGATTSCSVFSVSSFSSSFAHIAIKALTLFDPAPYIHPTFSNWELCLNWFPMDMRKSTYGFRTTFPHPLSSASIENEINVSHIVFTRELSDLL